MTIVSSDSTEERPPRPHGGADVSAAIIDAATRLFAETDPGTVTLRAIAEKAGVNYGLIHRHIGTKLDLVAAVVRQHSSRFVPTRRAESDAMALITEMAAHYLGEPAIARALAWSALNGASPESLVAELPDVAEMVRQLEARAQDVPGASHFFAFAAAAVLGVTVFGEIGLVAASVEDPQRHLKDLEQTTLILLAKMVDGLA